MKNKELRIRVGQITMAFLSIPIIIGIVLMMKGVEFHGVNTGSTLLALIIAYIILSFGYTKTGEIAMMTLFEDPIMGGDIDPGLYLAPLGIVQVRKVASTIFQDELPADPEKIFRDKGPVPQGMFPPNRVKFGPPSKVEPTDPGELEIYKQLMESPYNREMVAEVPVVVAWQIKSATGFFQTIGSVESCRKNLNDIAVDTFGDDFAKITPARAAFQNKETAANMKAGLQAKVAGFHITIHDAFAKPFIYGHHLNEEVEQVSIADLKAKGVRLKADGDAYAVEKAAEAEKARLIAVGQARTDGDGKITELVPDAATKAQTDAIGKLAETKGTVVLGEASTMIGIGKGGN